MSKHERDHVGQDHADWYMRKNPHAPIGDAIGFALFQCEMNMRIRLGCRAGVGRRIEQIWSDGRFNQEQKLDQYRHAVSALIEGIEKDLTDSAFLTENAAYMDNDKYLQSHDEFNDRSMRKSRSFLEGKQVWFPWGLSKKKAVA